MISSTSSPKRGSSPLARGLRDALHCQHHWQGIIPARAGFTAGESENAMPNQDHPRSRGVYWDAGVTERGHKGSSPLARGLLYDEFIIEKGYGIIPARAGFTSVRMRAGQGRKDHPRSRGVYAANPAAAAAEPGSSPLARGLPTISSPRSSPHRIIPARAGFTISMLTTTGAGRDHPRSRGVYWRDTDEIVQPVGSSPLARGLHLRILGIPTNPYSTRPRLPSLPT